MNLPADPAPVPPAPASPARFRVGDFRLDVTANELIAPDGSVSRIEPRLMALLVRLARVPGAVVSRETLIDEVWARRMVNDEVLSRAIADLRQALGDDSRTPRYIETIPKSGYRLIAAVEMETAEAVAPAVAATPASSQRKRPVSHWPVWMAAGLALMLASVAVFVGLRQQGAHRDGKAWQTALDTALREARPLTASTGLEVSPRLSQDGKRVLYTHIADRRAVLMLLDPALNAPRRIGGENDNANSGVFMPGNAGIVYRSLGEKSCVLRLQPALDAPSRDIAPCNGMDPPRLDVSPDGTSLVVSRTHRDTFPAGLALIDIASGNVRQLTTPGPADGEDTLPRFSPDGSGIAFVRGNSSARSVWLLPVQGGEPRKLSQLAGLTYGFAWVPNGDALVVAADWFGFRALNWLDVRTGNGHLLGARGARAPDVAGDRIVYENAIYQANLFRLRMSSTGISKVEDAARIHVSTRYTSQPVYSPDGNALTFVSNRDGTEALYIARADAAAQRVPLPDTHRYMRPAWSADGKSLYALRMPVAADKSAPQQAVRVVLETGASTVLPLSDNVSYIRESADGRWLYVGEREDRLMRLWRALLDAAGTPGKLERLPLPLASDVQMNRDRIAITQTGLKGVTLCALDGQSCTLVPLPMGDRHDDHWALTEGGLYFVDGEGAKRAVQRHDLKRGTVTAISALTPATLGAGLSVHPRESELMVAREEAPNIDLMIGTLPRLR
jgi:DNA-binding winged helix-turn-helix (wHTH) protein/Tol biopolymer transport system component